jgi:hypothetical protein
MNSSASLTHRCGFAILLVMPFGVLWLEELRKNGVTLRFDPP